MERSVRVVLKRLLINYASQQAAKTDADDPFKNLEEELDNLRKID